RWRATRSWARPSAWRDWSSRPGAAAGRRTRTASTRCWGRGDSRTAPGQIDAPLKKVTVAPCNLRLAGYAHWHLVTTRPPAPRQRPGLSAERNHAESHHRDLHRRPALRDQRATARGGQPRTQGSRRCRCGSCVPLRVHRRRYRGDRVPRREARVHGGRLTAPLPRTRSGAAMAARLAPPKEVPSDPDEERTMSDNIERRDADSRIWVLGAPDPEMEMIERTLRECGETVVYATTGDGERVTAGTAYRGESLVTDVGNHPCTSGVTDVYLVECALLTPDVRFEPGEDICHPELAGRTVRRIDHHRPGDPGYGRPPSEFLEA